MARHAFDEWRQALAHAGDKRRTEGHFMPEEDLRRKVGACGTESISLAPVNDSQNENRKHKYRKGVIRDYSLES